MSERHAEPVVRPMTVEDFGAVYRLGARCYDVTRIPYNYWSIREVADHLERNPRLCFVAAIDADVVGFLLGDATYEQIENAAHLEWVAVEPSRRRTGVATRLVEAALAAAAELGKATVVADVAADNADSRALASRLGFEEADSIILLTKRLG